MGFWGPVLLGTPAGLPALTKAWKVEEFMGSHKADWRLVWGERPLVQHSHVHS